MEGCGGWRLLLSELCDDLGDGYLHKLGPEGRDVRAGGCCCMGNCWGGGLTNRRPEGRDVRAGGCCCLGMIIYRPCN